MACTELGHVKCKGWLWKKRKSTGISFFSWKRYWLILKQSTLYWFSHLNDTKADGFIYLPEFRIHLARYCRNNNWVEQMLQLAYGSSFGDAAANEEHRCICATICANCILALMREFSVIWYNICNHSTPIVSVSQKFLHRHSQDVPDEFIYFRPIRAEAQEEAKRQKQQKSTVVSHQHTREEHSRPRTPVNLWLDSPENAKALGNDDFEVARSMYPFRERPIIRRSWEELLEAPLNNEGLHILQTIPAEQREIGYLQLPPKEENQATTSLRSHHLHVLQGPFPLLPQHTKLQRQHSHISSRYSDVRSQKLIAPMLKVNPEEKHFLPSDHTLFTRENTKKKENIKETWQNAILSASGGHSINPSIANSTSMRGKLGIPGDNGRHLRDNIRVPIDNVIIPMANVGVSMDNAAVPLNNFGVPRGNLEVPRGRGGVPRCHATRIPMFKVETPRNNVGASRRVVSSPLIELSKIGEHRL